MLLIMESDTREDFKVNGNLTVVANENVTDFGDGSIEVEGTIYSDRLRANTIGGPVTLQDIAYINGSFTVPEVSTPSNPVATKHTFYVDTTGKFKSVNNSGIVSVYHPATTKGDLQVHNGNVLVRLPVGSDGDILVADSAESTGVKWDNTIVNTTSNSDAGTSNTVTITGNTTTTTTIIIERPYGSYTTSVYPHIKNGGSCNIFCAKSLPNTVGNFVRINNNVSIVNSGSITGTWPVYTDVQLYKTHNEANGDYVVYNRKTIDLTVTLATTTPIEFNIVTTGVFLYSVMFDSISGPCATFYCCKNSPSLNSGVITRIISAPGLNNCNLNITWPLNDGLFLSKTTSSDYPGSYIIIDNFKNTNSTVSITLTGTSTTLVPTNTFPNYDKKSFFVSIKSSVSGSPNAIFSVSKNIYTTNANITYTGCPGITTLEQLNLTWNANNLLYLNKTGTNYNGVYDLVFTRLN